MTTSLGMADFVPLMQEIFKFGKTFKVTAKGGSMSPLLQDGRDEVILAACNPEKLKARDVPLYKREDGTYVLHRIIRVNKDGFVMCGDAQTELEKGVSKESVVAVAVAFVKNNKEISVKSRKYRIFSYLWCVVRPIRPILFCVYSIFRGKRKNEKRQKQK